MCVSAISGICVSPLPHLRYYARHLVHYVPVAYLKVGTVAKMIDNGHIIRPIVSSLPPLWRECGHCMHCVAQQCVSEVCGWSPGNK